MRIALLQAEACHDIDLCLDLLDHHLAAVKSQGASLFVTPEMWVGGYNIAPEKLRDHGGRFDQVVKKIGQIVRRHGVALVVGCASIADGKLYNSAVAFDAHGDQVACYAKCHLFSGLDQERFTPGSMLSPVFELAGMQVGLAICYDIEFPETARSLALRGARLIIVPTANMTPYESVNQRLIPARAEENGVFVAYANLCGVEGELAYCGLSCLCGPNGNTIAAGGAGGEIIFADIDPAQVTEIHKTRPFLRDRREEIYFKKD